MKPLRIGIVGVGGYAVTHMRIIDTLEQRGECELRAAVIRNPARYAKEESELAGRSVAVHRSYPEMLERQKGKLDIVVIPGGIDQHEPQSAAALESGYHVLCEKPVAGTFEEAVRMHRHASKTGRILAIGFQFLHSPSVQRIKRLILEGEMGPLKSAKMISYQPRTSAYYMRNSWAGRIQANGRTILDSPLQNAVAHHLNNMLYFAGSLPGASAAPLSVYGENYRAKDIESADTQFIRVETREGTLLTGMASHAVERLLAPIIELTGERGSILWSPDGGTKIYRGAGRERKLAEEWNKDREDMQVLMYEDLFDSIRKDRPPRCHIGNAMQHTLCIDKMFQSCKIRPVPPPLTEKRKALREVYTGIEADESSYNIVVKGLEQVMDKMFKGERSFFETGLPWAVRGEVLPISPDMLS
ncbi:MAG TPA: Gfo/Idh/MocA family oxidoreductase [Spirochaetia bacterium]|nr:Gfo/Idh/MocA family oxidoreductase [Spirochaetia bacterium]